MQDRTRHYYVAVRPEVLAENGVDAAMVRARFAEQLSRARAIAQEHPEVVSDIVGDEEGLVADGAMDAPSRDLTEHQWRRVEESRALARAGTVRIVTTHTSDSRAAANNRTTAREEVMGTITTASKHVLDAPHALPFELQTAQLAAAQSVAPVTLQTMAVMRASEAALAAASRAPGAKRSLARTDLRRLPIGRQATFQRRAVGQAYQGRVVLYVLVALIGSLPLSFQRYRRRPP